MSPVTSEWFAKRLAEAGVISAEELNEISRIVIDCTVGNAVQVYVQRFGQADALEKARAHARREAARRQGDGRGRDPGAPGGK